MIECEFVIVLPIYNEINRLNLIKIFSEQVIKFLTRLDRSIAVLYIDDGSTDGSQQAIEKLICNFKQKYTSLQITQSKIPQNTGKSGIYLEALSVIDSDYYLFVDSDASFCIEDVAHCIEMSADYDVLLAQKLLNKAQYTLFRRIATQLHGRLTRKIFSNTISDTQTGLKVFSRCAAQTTFKKVRHWHRFASDFVIVYEAYHTNLRIHQISVNAKHQAGSHVHLIRDGLYYLMVVFVTVLLGSRPIKNEN